MNSTTLPYSFGQGGRGNVAHDDILRRRAALMARRHDRKQVRKAELERQEKARAARNLRVLQKVDAVKNLLRSTSSQPAALKLSYHTTDYLKVVSDAHRKWVSAVEGATSLQKQRMVDDARKENLLYSELSDKVSEAQVRRIQQEKLRKEYVNATRLSLPNERLTEEAYNTTSQQVVPPTTKAHDQTFQTHDESSREQLHQLFAGRSTNYSARNEYDNSMHAPSSGGPDEEFLLTSTKGPAAALSHTPHIPAVEGNSDATSTSSRHGRELPRERVRITPADSSHGSLSNASSPRLGDSMHGARTRPSAAATAPYQHRKQRTSARSHEDIGTECSPGNAPAATVASFQDGDRHAQISPQDVRPVSEHHYGTARDRTPHVGVPYDQSDEESEEDTELPSRTAAGRQVPTITTESVGDTWQSGDAHRGCGTQAEEHGRRGDRRRTGTDTGNATPLHASPRRRVAAGTPPRTVVRVRGTDAVVPGNNTGVHGSMSTLSADDSASEQRETRESTPEGDNTHTNTLHGSHYGEPLATMDLSEQLNTSGDYNRSGALSPWRQRLRTQERASPFGSTTVASPIPQVLRVCVSARDWLWWQGCELVQYGAMPAMKICMWVHVCLLRWMQCEYICLYL